jgi:hypothetical protein
MPSRLVLRAGKIYLMRTWVDVSVIDLAVHDIETDTCMDMFMTCPESEEADDWSWIVVRPRRSGPLVDLTGRDDHRLEGGSPRIADRQHDVASGSVQEGVQLHESGVHLDRRNTSPA